MRKVTSIVIMALGLTACGTTTVIREVAPSTTTPVVTTPAVNKYEEYIFFVQSKSGQAQFESAQDMIGVADTICASLISGKTVSEISNTLNSTAVNDSVLTLYAAMMYGAIKYICPEYMPALTAYLNT